MTDSSHPGSSSDNANHLDITGRLGAYSGEVLQLPDDPERLAELIPDLFRQLQSRLGARMWDEQKAWVGKAEQYFANYQIINSNPPLYRLRLVYTQLGMIGSILDVVDKLDSYTKSKGIIDTPISTTSQNAQLNDAGQVLKPVLNRSLKFIDVACNTSTEIISAAVGGVIQHDIFRPLQKKLSNLIDLWAEEFHIPKDILGADDAVIADLLFELRDLMSFLAMLIVAHLDKVSTKDLADTFRYTGKRINCEDIAIGSIGLTASLHTLILNALDYSDEVTVKKATITSEDTETSSETIPLVPPSRARQVKVNSQAIELTNIVDADRALKLLQVCLYYQKEMQKTEGYLPTHGMETAAQESFTVVRVTKQSADTYVVSIKISVVPYRNS